MAKLPKPFYLESTQKVAESLIGKDLVVKRDGEVIRAQIIETEAYQGFEDKASHASKGQTERNAPMFKEGGISYIYLVYGIYHMLNIVTEKAGYPSAVLIRALDCQDCDGPGKLTRELKITKEKYNGINLTQDRIWVEDKGRRPRVKTGKRIGIGYAGKWANKPWRFFLN
jgi:DNA-3-methyladenine glycosylase